MKTDKDALMALAGPDRIWLEPISEDGCYGSEGRLWCEDRVWDDGVLYIRADLVRSIAQSQEQADG